MSTLVQADRADQHLTEQMLDPGTTASRLTLCGRRFDSLPLRVGIYDHRDGFSPTRPNGCAVCADKADAIQNGRA